MPSFKMNKMRRTSGSQRRYPDSVPQPSMNYTPDEPPPSYEAAVSDSTQPLGRTESETSPAFARPVSAPYRQTHQPPDYQSSTDLSRRQTITHIAPTPAPTAALPHSGQSLTQALSKAALAGKSDTVRSLLEAGADIYEPSPFGPISAVHDALRGPEPELALLLLDYPCERAYQGSLSSSGATLGGEARVGFLLSVEDKDGCTPLHLAASAGATEVVREMLELGAAVDATDKLGRTPLHMAARYGRVEAMEVLLEHGAEPDLVREDLWKRAGPKAQTELGDYTFVKRSIARAVWKRSGVKGGEDEDETVRSAERKPNRAENAQHDRSVEEASQSSKSTGTPQRRSVPSSAGIGASGASVEPGSVRSGGLFGRYHKGPAPSPAGFCTTWTNSTGRHAPRLPDTSMYSPQYDAWRKMCQTVQEEHRRQKERNVAAGFGPYEGLV